MSKIIYCGEKNTKNDQCYQRIQSRGMEIINLATLEEVITYNSEEPIISIVAHLEDKEQKQIDLLKKIKKQFPKTTLVLSLDNYNLNTPHFLSKTEIEAISPSEILITPYNDQQLLDAISSFRTLKNSTHLPLTQTALAPSPEVTDNDFLNFDDSQHIEYQTLFFDLYVSISSEKYKKVLGFGETLDKNSRTFIEKVYNTTDLFIHPKQILDYLNYQNQNISRLCQRGQLNQIELFNLLFKQLNSLMKGVKNNGVCEKGILVAKQICHNYLLIVSHYPDITPIMEEVKSMEPSPLHKQHLCNFLTHFLADSFDYQERYILETLGPACLLKDIGLAKLSPEILDRPIFLLSKEDLDEYQKHPEYSLAMIHEPDTVSHHFKEIILQHHEACDGSGFPRELKDEEIVAPAKIVFFTDQLSDLILEKQIGLVDAMKLLFSDPETPNKFDSFVIKNFLAKLTKNKVHQMNLNQEEGMTFHSNEETSEASDEAS